MTKKRKLYRDTENQQIAGVCSGLSDYLDIDVTIIRVIWVVLVLCYGTGILVYIIMAIIVEPKKVVMDREKKKHETVDQDDDDDDPFAKYD